MLPETQLPIIHTINFSELPFDYVAHPLRNISYPHSTYPALLWPEKLLYPKFLQQITDYQLSLYSRTTNTEYFLQAESNGYSAEGVAPGLYDIILYINNAIADVQTHAVKVFANKPTTAKFAQITDTHFPAFTKEFNTSIILPAVFANLSAEQPDFVLHTGDLLSAELTYEVNTTTGESLYSYTEILQNTLRFLDAYELAIFIVAGNHHLKKVPFSLKCEIY